MTWQSESGVCYAMRNAEDRQVRPTHLQGFSGRTDLMQEIRNA